MRHSLEEITGFIYCERANVESEFDAIYRDRFEESFDELLRLFNILQNAHEHEGELHDGTLNAALLLWGTLQSVFVSLQIFRSGFWRDANILLRAPLETAAMALYLHKNPKELESFRQGKDLYGKALGLTRKIIRTFKTERELLSQMFLHPSAFDGIIDISKGSLMICGQLNQDGLHRYGMSLLNIEKCLVNLGMIIEYIFFDFSSEPIYWKREKEDLKELPTHSKYLERFFANAQIVKEQTGIDMLKGQEKAVEILEKVLKLRKDKESNRIQ